MTTRAITGRTNSTVALVESPAQLLNAIEWAWSEAVEEAGGLDGLPRHFGSRVAIRVLAPLDATGRVQLHRMTELARAAGFDVGWREVRGGPWARSRSIADLSAELARADSVLIGDPFSGVIQFLVAMVGPSGLVVVDDGSATLEFAEILRERRELLRWHDSRRVGRGGRTVAAAAKRRMLASASGPRLFTSMPVTPSSLSVRHNHLGWVRWQWPAPVVRTGTAEVVGTSLVETGIVQSDYYLDEVGRLAAEHGAARYLAHRRESPAKLAEVERRGLRVVRPELPLEIVTRIGPVPERIISFPSTVVHTLPLSLADTEVEVLVCDIAPHGFRRGQQGSRTGDFLRSVAETACRTYGLGRV